MYICIKKQRMQFLDFKKKQFFFIVLLLTGVPSFSQTEEPKPKKIADPKDRIVVDFNYDSFTHLPKGISQKPYSLGGNVYFIWDYPVGYGPISLAFGAGFSTHDVHTNGKIVYSVDGEYTSFVPITTKYNTNKLSCNYFEIPLELRMRTRGDHDFLIYLGFKTGYAFNVQSKFEDADGKK
jgi:hypothetical protein